MGINTGSINRIDEKNTGQCSCSNRLQIPKISGVDWVQRAENRQNNIITEIQKFPLSEDMRDTAMACVTHRNFLSEEGGLYLGTNMSHFLLMVSGRQDEGLCIAPKLRSRIEVHRRELLDENSINARVLAKCTLPNT